MIAYLKGKIIHQELNYIILDVNNIGYKIFTTKAINHPPLAISEFWIHEHIREDFDDLYGFKNIKELEFFELLLKVNGVGPKMALNIMSKNSIEKLKEAISGGDVKILTAVGGVGKKIAGKIIVELKNKLSDDKNINLSSTDSEEVLGALSQLGYNENEIVPYLSKLPANLKNSTEKVKWILKNLKS